MKFNKENIIKLFNIRKEKNFLIKEENQLNNELKSYLTENNVNFLKYKNIIVSIGTRNRKEFDITMFKKEYPNIDIKKYFVSKNYEILNFTEL